MQILNSKLSKPGVSEFFVRGPHALLHNSSMAGHLR